MRIERINENQIRCTLSSFDLSVRDLNISELAYGSEKAKKLFREMIQKASHEVGFEAEDMPLMVEAIPLSGESIMLIITRIEDPEELDTRFSRFSPMTEEERPMAAFANELLEGADGILELFARSAANLSGTAAPNSNPLVSALEGSLSALPTSSAGPSSPAEPGGQAPEEAVPAIRFFSFDSLDAVCRAAAVTGPAYDGPNILYKNPVNGRFYLVLQEKEDGDASFHKICNLLTEYGTAIKALPTAEAYYKEHYEIIVKEHALQILSGL